MTWCEFGFVQATYGETHKMDGGNVYEGADNADHAYDHHLCAGQRIHLLCHLQRADPLPGLGWGVLEEKAPNWF